MAINLENIEIVNELLTLLERVNNLEGKCTLGKDIADRARTQINKGLETYFPPPEPPE